MIFRPHTDIPNAAGWYRVRRVDDEAGVVRLRAFGQGHWWTPLVDGWISSDGVYEWESLPVCAISDDEELSPLAEMKRAEEVANRGTVTSTGGSDD